MASSSAAQPLRAMDSAGEPVVVRVRPREKNDAIIRGNMTIEDVDPDFGAPNGAKILAVNGVNVSSWGEYLQRTRSTE